MRARPTIATRQTSAPAGDWKKRRSPNRPRDAEAFLSPPDGRRVSGERGAEDDERVRGTRMSGDTPPKTNVEYSRERERPHENELAALVQHWNDDARGYAFAYPGKAYDTVREACVVENRRAP